MEVVINNEIEGTDEVILNRSIENIPIATSNVNSVVNSDHVSESVVFDSIDTFKCFACRAARAKYRCPGCATPTCSLPCVRKHKALLECDGQRNRVKFRRLEQFTNLDILSDYRLLEEISRDNESKKRKPRYRNKESKKTRLKDNVRVLCDVILHLLPPHFVRAKENDSSWDAKKKTAKWRIGWDFEGVVIQTAPLKDSTILQTALYQATSQMPNAERLKWKKLITKKALKLTLQQEKGMSSELQRSLRLGGIARTTFEAKRKIFLKKEEKSVRWPANLKTTIASNLRGSTFIEFPTFKVEILKLDEGGLVGEEKAKEQSEVETIEKGSNYQEKIIENGSEDEAEDHSDDVSETADSTSEGDETEDEDEVMEEVANVGEEAKEEEAEGEEGEEAKEEEAEGEDQDSDEDESDRNTSSLTGTSSLISSVLEEGEEDEGDDDT